MAGACLRLTADYVRTAIAKGLRYGPVVRRHAVRGAYPGVTSMVCGYIPVFVTNVVLVEWVWNVPGFWLSASE